MSHRTLSRLIAAIIMFVIVAAAINITHIQYHHQGRDAYLEAQSQKYDRYIAEPDMAAPLPESLLMCGAFILLYEIIAYNSFKIITTVSRRPEPTGK